MDDGGPTASIFLFFLFLLIDFFFFGFGAAVDFLNAKDVAKRAEDGDKKSKYLIEIIEQPKIFINTLQMVVTFLHISIGIVCAKTVDLPVREFTVLLIAILYIFLTFGILLPKKIAAKTSEKWAYLCVKPVFAVMKILSPLTWLVAITVKGVLILLGLRSGEEENEVTEEEIIDMVNEGHEQGVIQASEAELITNIFEYGDKEAQDIMTHRNDIIAIEANTSLKEAISFMLEEKNSRYPVYEENIDHIIGILHLKDAFRMQAQGKDDSVAVSKMRGLLRKPLFVPQTKNIDELFKKMQSEKIQMVIVVNEYGQTDGLIAMEDILEEIVGNILDEYDDDAEYIEQKGLNEY
ncbi:MAG: hemolysin family protein, partial [Acetatifactor sp.]|nr:hemolysin family protein [Acetatifactor sp.]